MYSFISSFTQQQKTSLEFIMCYHIDLHQTHTNDSTFNVVTETCDIPIVSKRIRSSASVCLCTYVPCMYVYVCIQALLCDYACKYVATYGCVHV